MAKHTTDTKTTKRVTGNESKEGKSNTAKAGEAAGAGADSGDENPNGEGGDTLAGDEVNTDAGPQTVGPNELAGQKGDLGGALALDEKDVQTESQVKAGLRGTSDRPGRGEPQEFIETKPGSVQSTRPNNDPAA